MIHNGYPSADVSHLSQLRERSGESGQGAVSLLNESGSDAEQPRPCTVGPAIVGGGAPNDLQESGLNEVLRILPSGGARRESEESDGMAIVKFAESAQIAAGDAAQRQGIG